MKVVHRTESQLPIVFVKYLNKYTIWQKWNKISHLKWTFFLIGLWYYTMCLIYLTYFSLASLSTKKISSFYRRSSSLSLSFKCLALDFLENRTFLVHNVILLKWRLFSCVKSPMRWMTWISEYIYVRQL